MRHLLWMLSLVLPLSAAADEKADDAAAGLAREVAPYLDDQVLAVMHLDLTKLDVDAALAALRKAGLADKQAEAVGKVARPIVAGLTGLGLKRGFVVVSLADVPEQPPLLVLPLPPGNE